MFQNPMEDFRKIKEDMKEIVSKESKSLLFYELSRSISATEIFILQDDIENPLFLENLSQVVVDALALFCALYDVESAYSFLESRKHWGDYNEEDFFEDTYESLVKPFYELRIEVSRVMLKEQKGFRVKPLFKLAKFEKYIEGEI